MDVRSIGGLINSQSQQNIQKSTSKLQSAIASLISGTKSSTVDVAALSIATQLQSQVSNLKQASGNIAQASSLAQVADGGAQQIGEVLNKLRALADRANAPTANADNRRALDAEFQSLVAEIDRLASGTSFNNQKLLDGNISGDKSLSLTKLLGATESIDNGALQIQSLKTSDLFDAKKLSIASPETIAQAVSALDKALNTVSGARASIGSFQQTLNFAAANIESAAANQEAARSILQDTDFAQGSTETSLANILRNAQIAVQAQGNRLTPNLLKLVS